MKQNSKNLLIIFTRPPVLGKVKTRLAEDIGPQAALDIYKYLLQHTLAITRELQVDKLVCYAGDIPENDIWDSNSYQKSLQRGSDLGERMQNAFEDGFRQGFSRIILIGSDLYDLTQADLEEAFRELEHYPFVIGPALDGGYYLIGMKESHPLIFKNKTWSSSGVFQDTLKDLRGEEISYLEYRNDIDVVSDIPQCPELQQFIQHL